MEEKRIGRMDFMEPLYMPKPQEIQVETSAGRICAECGSASDHRDIPARQLSDRRRIQTPFGPLDAFVKAFRRVSVQHRNAFLADDGPAVDALIDEVHRAACDLYPVL